MRMATKQKNKIEELEKKGYKITLKDFNDGEIVLVRMLSSVPLKTIRRVVRRDGTTYRLGGLNNE